MIQLKGIKKTYNTDERKVHALKGITLDMRDSEFVCVLGPSGCGKTTLLNIIGGLDRYTSGDLIIDGKSTKHFTDVDWDTYRSRKVGFVFQSYNLISHQTVLENVETALVISGIGREERRKRAIQALVDVGLSEHLRKTPRQLSGGEMQRVAIARALVNNPKMILADEPTGALDSENSVKIMDLLKEISKDRLVVMVTHNAELASEYATRTIRMKDGLVVSDDKPFKATDTEKKQEEKEKKQSHMPYTLAAKLSIKNLAGKKIRTALTSVASSIAIIGIALVLACHNGLNAFIDKVQKDTMSSVPITVSTSDYNYQIDEILGYINSTAKGDEEKGPIESVLINHALKNMQPQNITNEISTHFVDYLKGLDSSRVRYDAVKNVSKRVYKNVRLPIYSNTEILKEVSVLDDAKKWACLPPDRSILEDQYHLVAGKYPENPEELLLVVDKNSAVADTVLATYLLDVYAIDEEKTHYTYEEILNTPELNEYHLVLNDDYYVERDGGFYADKTISLAKYIHKYYRSETLLSTIEGELNKNEFIKLINELGVKVNCFDVVPETDGGSKTLKIVGIIKLNDDTQYGMFTSPIAYLPSLNELVIENSYSSAIVQAQFNDTSVSVLDRSVIATGDKIRLNNILSDLGYAELPTKIKFYPNTIEDKDYLIEYLDAYNETNGDNPDITYTDNVGAIIDVVRIVVGSVSAILLALTSISLIVSSIMIGIITYVSVIERTKEIGVLRSVGARKKDVVRLFVTETGVIGLVAGICGLLLTMLIAIPLNTVMGNLTGVTGFVFLRWWNYIAIVLGSSLLTVMAGFIPSLLASKKDPVKALRSE